MTNHIMLDLETFGTKPGCVLRSIGMAFFDPCSDWVGPTYYKNFREEEQLSLGCHKDPGTIVWWKQQSKESQEQLLIDQASFQSVADEIISFYKRNKGKFIWSQGANFDIVLLEHNLALAGLKAPWAFYNARDTRTAYHMNDFDTKSIDRQGTYHNALDDALHQIRCVQASYKKGRPNVNI